jgi:hypothetical protein
VVTVRLTVKVPASVYAWLGFGCVLVPPSPKLHTRLMMLALPGVDWSVNWTVNVAVPDVGVPVNCASGGTGCDGGHPTKDHDDTSRTTHAPKKCLLM